MSENTPLYNSRITKIYLEYLNKTYPELDIDYILKYAEMTSDEVEDQAHWFSQHQVDRFQEAVIQKTGNINIAREAGRYAASSEAIGVAKHYMLGLLNLTTLYMLIGRVYSIFSRAVTIKAKKIGQNKVEIISTPMPGVNEKPYQCENRAGMFESVAKLFNVKFANIEHSLCFHRGDSCCRYIISWDKRPSLVWVTARNYFIIFAPIFFLIFYFFVSFKVLIPIAVLIFLIITCFSFVPLILEKKELTKTIETQGNLSKDLLDEMSIRHNNALLIQEIGQATSSILDIDVLLNAVINSMKTHMDFDRGLIMLSNPDKTMLIFKAGYGYTEEKEKVLQKTEFHLDNPKSKGVFVLAHKNKEPFLISNFSEIEKKLSAKSLEFAREMEAESLICTPIIYEKESLGILAVDNIKSKRQLTKSDLSFIMGVASQMAISIVNARSYQRLQESEKKYRELVENANSIIMRVDRDNKITFFNEYAQNFFGFTENEILGKSLEDTIFKNTEITMRDPNITQAYLSQKSQIQIISESKTGEENIKKEWIAWTYKPIFNESGQLLESLYIGNDITELKIAELEKKELEARLQRAQKMEAIGMLAGGVAHDLNNVLSGIVSYPELIIMDLPPNSPLLRPISTIQKAGERAAAIVQDLLTLARRGVVTTKVVNLNNIISDYLKSPEYANLITHHPNVKVTINLQKNLLNIVGSPIHLAKTIMNLVTNAVEAISNSGEITIITENLYVDKNINGFDEVKQGSYVTFIIKDTGVGIYQQDIERIFEPFYTKKVMGKSGTGLGMAVVWGTVKDHNGYIDVKSTPGVGTSFSLYFPVTMQALLETDPSFSLEKIKGKGERILIVDDVEEQIEIASSMLSKLGYSIASALSGEEALEYLRKDSANLIVLDMILEGGMDGLDTYKKILEIKPGQKAIIASGFSETERVKEAQRLGVRQYLKKPYLLEKIGRAVKEALDS